MRVTPGHGKSVGKCILRYGIGGLAHYGKFLKQVGSQRRVKLIDETDEIIYHVH